MTSTRPYCNCRLKESCPLNGDCLQYSVAYGCKIISNYTAEYLEHYVGFTKNTFKDRLYKQKRAPLNTKLKRIAPNFQIKYGTKRKINKRYHLSRT